MMKSLCRSFLESTAGMAIMVALALLVMHDGATMKYPLPSWLMVPMDILLSALIFFLLAGWLVHVGYMLTEKGRLRLQQLDAMVGETRRSRR